MQKSNETNSIKDNSGNSLRSQGHICWINNRNKCLSVEPYLKCYVVTYYKIGVHLSVNFLLHLDYMTKMTCDYSIFLEPNCQSNFWVKVNGGNTYLTFI